MKALQSVPALLAKQSRDLQLSPSELSPSELSPSELAAQRAQAEVDLAYLLGTGKLRGGTRKARARMYLRLVAEELKLLSFSTKSTSSSL